MKTLNDVINAVQHETQLSRSQLSLKIGKSRNYLNTTVKNGLSHEKEQEIIALLLDLVDDENTMLRNALSIKEELIDAYRTKLKKVINENLDIVKEKNDEIETLKEDKEKRHRELVDYENKCENMIDNLNETIATKNLFIDGLDMENKGLMERISKLEKNLKHIELVKDRSCELNDELIRDSKKLMSKISGLEQKIVILGKEIDNSHTRNKELKNRISKNEEVFLATSNHNDSLLRKLDILDRENQYIKISHLVAIDEEQSCKNKVRFLTASIIGLVAIFSVYLWVK